MRLIPAILQACLMVIASANTWAQSPVSGSLGAPGFKGIAFLGQPVFRSYGPDEGLNSLGINQLAQDKDGFLWLGTDLGLFRYDGHRFQHFGRKEGLASDSTTLVWADPKGGLWVSGTASIQKIEGDRILLPDAPSGLPKSPALSLARDSQGRLWLAMGMRGLWRETSPSHFEKVENYPNPWVVVNAPRHGGLFIFGPQDRAEFWKGGKKSQTFSGKDGLGIDPVAGCEDREGRLWVLDSKGLNFKLPGESSFRPFRHPVVEPGGQMRTMTPDGKGGFWIATVSGLLHVKGSTWRAITDKNGLPTHSANAVLQDREGNLWYASGGLFRQLGLSAWFNQTPKDGLPTETVWCLTRDPRNRLWAGTDKGLAVLEGDRWRHLPETQGIPVQSIAVMTDGSIFAAGKSLDLIRVDPSGLRGRLHRLPVVDTLQDSDLRVLRDSRDHLWVAGHQLWRVAWDGSRPAVQETLEVPKGMYISGSSMIESRDGRLWLASLSGLAEIFEGRWKNYTIKDGLPGEDLGSIAEAPDGSLLVSFRDALGLTRLVKDAQGIRILRHYRAAKGELPTDAVFSAHVDRDGNTWLNTNLGAVRVREDGFRVFGRNSGFLNQDMVQGSFLSDPDGTLWFGTCAGLMRFQSRSYPWNLPLPKVILPKLSFGGKPLLLQSGQPLRVAPKDSTFEVALGCLSYSIEKAFNYEVRLEGLEQEWRTEDISIVRYPALRPGNYSFQARIRFDGQVGPITSIEFEILPRWYQTHTFRVLAFLALGPVLWGFFVWRNRILKARNLHLEELVRARTRQLEDTNRILEEQSLHDPLTGLFNRRYLSLTLPENIAQALRLVQPSKRNRVQSFLLDHPLLFLILDLDHFKQINDEYGHAVGDEVLRSIGAILLDLMRESDTVARWGGEEFLVVARQVGIGDPAGIADRIKQAVNENRVTLEDGTVLQVSVSIGFCPFPLGFEAPVLPWEKAVMLADRALYAAKRSGRNGWIGLVEGPAFDAKVLLEASGHPDIPDLIRKGILHVEHSFEELKPDVWI